MAGTAQSVAEKQFIMGNEGGGVRLPVTGAATFSTFGDPLEIGTADFDPDTDEKIALSFKMPGNYQSQTSISIEIVWMSENTTASRNSVFTADYWAVADTEDLDGATVTGSPVSGIFTDNITSGGRNTHTLTLITPVIEPEDFVGIIFTRDADNASDTLTNDARVLQINIRFSVNS